MQQERAIDNLVAFFETQVAHMVEQARRETVHAVVDKLAMTDGVIDRTARNVHVLQTIERTFQRAMADAGYLALVSSYVKSFKGQFQFFRNVLEELGAQLGREITVAFGARDKASFLRQMGVYKDMLHEAVAIQARAAQQQALFSVGALRVSYLTVMIAKQLDMTAARASSLADTSLSTFYRTIADHGYQQIEAKLSKDIGLLYKYGGPSDKLTRPKCREWLLATRETGFTRKQINALSNGQLANVFVTCGGYRCRHQWVPQFSLKAKEKEGVPV